MPKRNLMNIVNNVKVAEKYDLTIDDMFTIKKAAIYCDQAGELFESIVIAFKYGYAMGQRAEKKKSSQGAGTTKRAKSE